MWSNPSLFVNKPLIFSVGIAAWAMPSLVLPSIERRFSFSSKELGIISAANDASALIVMIFISFYGDYCNKIRWMGYGAVVSGTSWAFLKSY